ncbi:hypothetical protein GGH20_002718, partial [Coemansia sp. RSA 1937]
ALRGRITAATAVARLRASMIWSGIRCCTTTPMRSSALCATADLRVSMCCNAIQMPCTRMLC